MKFLKAVALKKNFFRLFLIAVICCFSLTSVVAQDIHFSQFYASPLSLNPAETGLFDGNWRFTNNYRTQWSAIGVPYRTISAGFDKPFKLRKESKLGLGVFFVNDQSGASNLLVNKLFLNGNYIISINKAHSIGIGAQIGYILKSFTLNGLSLPSQFNDNTGVFDPDLPNNITNLDESINYVDINLGVSYFGKIGKNNPYGGVSLFHLNTPKESFLNTEDKLPMRIVFNAGIIMPITEKINLRPSILTMYHKKAGDWVIGTLGYYIMPKQKHISNIFAGIHTRYSLNNMDAIILTGGLGFYGFDIGISYDINISKLQIATKNKGAVEISLIYKNVSQKLSRVALPCDRY